MAEYIEREKTVELLRSLGNRRYCKEKGTIQDAIKMISFPEYTPSADVAPVVHGRWMHSRYEDCSEQFKRVKCSQCDQEAYAMAFYVVDGHYCPNCGAKMDGGTT